MRGMRMETKVFVYTKSGKKLTYYDTATYEETKRKWRDYLSKKDVGVGLSFGMFAIAVENIDYVHVVPN